MRIAETIGREIKIENLKSKLKILKRNNKKKSLQNKQKTFVYIQN